MKKTILDYRFDSGQQQDVIDRAVGILRRYELGAISLSWGDIRLLNDRINTYTKKQIRTNRRIDTLLTLVDISDYNTLETVTVYSYGKRIKVTR